MKYRTTSFRSLLKLLTLLASCIGLLCIATKLEASEPLESNEPILYKLKFPEPKKQIAEVEVVFSTNDQASIELMMPIWSPG